VKINAEPCGLTTKPMFQHFTRMKTFAALAASILLAGVFYCRGQDATNSTPETMSETNAETAAPSFDGDWRGPVKCVAAGGGADTNFQYRLRIVINGDSAIAYELKNKKWSEIADESSGSVKYTVSKMQDMCVVTWLNHDPGGDWTEEQTYSLSFINPSKIRVIQLRHVNRLYEGKNNKPWFYVCEGVLTKTN
jgi:hypothetical protein